MKYDTSAWLRSTSTCTVVASTSESVMVPNSVPLGPQLPVHESTSRLKTSGKALAGAAKPSGNAAKALSISALAAQDGIRFITLAPDVGMQGVKHFPCR